MDWSLCSAVDRTPGKLGGTWCFRGTRLPVATLFEHLDQGSSVDEFLEWFPAVSRELIDEYRVSPAITDAFHLKAKELYELILIGEPNIELLRVFG